MESTKTPNTSVEDVANIHDPDVVAAAFGAQPPSTSDPTPIDSNTEPSSSILSFTENWKDRTTKEMREMKAIKPNH